MVANNKGKSPQPALEQETETQPSEAVEEPNEPAVEVKSRPVLVPNAVPGSMTDDGYYVPRGNVERVECPLFPIGLVVHFNTSVAFRVLTEEYEGPGDTVVEKECRRLCAFITGFENWRFKTPMGEIIPEPNPADWNTYVPIVIRNGPVVELYPWLIGRGLSQALQQSMGNSASS